ncbi:hypothetical protein FHR32_002278 [Streptosporangium album]|uniref:Uncharacterized protein n=1 Tax=Streptosporangium album TaxID=47479 RepID=A0A7W7RUW4_9ACTN|nr:hypothetical protein [Streptosporangium album]MBB4937973.1 hypothetical protein [Streptosporangium album]
MTTTFMRLPVALIEFPLTFILVFFIPIASQDSGNAVGTVAEQLFAAIR